MQNATLSVCISRGVYSTLGTVFGDAERDVHIQIIQNGDPVATVHVLQLASKVEMYRSTHFLPPAYSEFNVTGMALFLEALETRRDCEYHINSDRTERVSFRYTRHTDTLTISQHHRMSSFEFHLVMNDDLISGLKSLYTLIVDHR